MKKKIPVNVPLDYNGSFYEVFQSFINDMQTVTGDNVLIDCDLKGNIKIYYVPVDSTKENERDVIEEINGLLNGELNGPSMSDPISKFLRTE